MQTIKSTICWAHSAGVPRLSSSIALSDQWIRPISVVALRDRWLQPRDEVPDLGAFINRPLQALNKPAEQKTAAVAVLPAIVLGLEPHVVGRQGK
jgi:hypothetical protein